MKSLIIEITEGNLNIVEYITVNLNLINHNSINKKTLQLKAFCSHKLGFFNKI